MGSQSFRSSVPILVSLNNKYPQSVVKLVKRIKSGWIVARQKYLVCTQAFPPVRVYTHDFDNLLHEFARQLGIESVVHRPKA